MAAKAEPVEDYLKKVKKDLVKEQKKLGFFATGRTSGTLVIEEDKRFKRPEAVFKLKSDKRGNITYKTMQEGGRKPGKFPSIQNLRRWVQAKGIRPREGQTIQQLTYLIGRSLAEEGNLVHQNKRTALDLEGIVEKHLPKLTSQIADELVDDILEVIDKTLPVKR